MAEYTWKDYAPGESQEMGAGGQSSATSTEFQAARDRLKTAYATAREKSSEALGQAEEYTRKSPLEALGYAAGAGAVLGLVVGLLFGRKA